MAADEIFESASRAAGDLAAVFEYDGETGYFYLYELQTGTGVVQMTKAINAMKELDVSSSVRRDELEEFKSALGEVDLKKTTTGGRNLLHVAIAYHRPDHARELILRGIDVNQRDHGGETALHYAAIHADPTTAVLLLEHGGEPAAADKHGNTPLWYAVFNARGDYEMVTLLLGAGADPTRRNSKGRSPSDFARQIQDGALVELLCSKQY
jgi:uncharacterized protein